jgi:amino acid adenylation domain-containing protein
LNIAALDQSVKEMVRRHESLRTSFSISDGQPVQILSPSLIVRLPLLDISGLSAAERDIEAQRFADEENQRAFDLARGPLLRCKLLRLHNNDHVFLVTMHHIVSDGWSMGVFFRELSALYEAFSKGKSVPLVELPIQYADYAVWQREWLKEEILDTQLSYWKKRLANLCTLQLPTDRPRPAVQTFRGAGRSAFLSRDLAERLKTLNRKEGVTLFMTLLAAFQVLLYRYTGQEDIVVGTPIAGRTRAEVEGLIGFLVNTLVLRGDLSGNPTFRELLIRVRLAAFEAYTHQDVPFEKLVEELQPQRNLSHSPLFQVMFVFHNAPAAPLEFQGLSVSPVTSASDTAKFDLTLSIREENGGLGVHLQYNTDLFDGSTVDRLLSHFENLLQGIVADPDRRLSDFSILTQDEQHQLLVEWNDTKGDFPKDKCVHQLFEEQVERTPDAIAVVFRSQKLTYRELNQRANQLAHYLLRVGLGPEQLVGIFVERSPEMVVAALGVLKAGGAYVPLDHESPKERLAFFLQDTKTSILLTQQPLVERLPPSEAQLLCLDPDWMNLRQEPIGNPVFRGVSARLAYVAYTSGSTGQPKGVMIEHRSLVNYLHWVNNRLFKDDICAVPMITDINFDACLKQLFAPLLCGKQVWLVPRDVVIEPAALLQEIRGQVRVGLNCVPSLWAAIVNQIDSFQAITLSETLKYLLLGGERLGKELVAKSFAAIPALEIWNLYGPTETTANASNGKVASSGKVTIGKPITNAEIYLLDPQLQPVPVGITGEVYIGGIGLARGYLNRPELTAEKFIASPVSSKTGARLYRTGDLARYLSDGNIEYLGRIDHQVKIRGLRIELGEIEAALNQHLSVRENVVLAREDILGDKQLVAYIVSDQQAILSLDNLRSFLRQKLPEYMVPTAFVFLNALPLMPNGKVDRGSLPPPSQSSAHSEQSYVAPRTPEEEKLAKIWAQVLKLESVGVRDSFFDLGGHSLLATQIMSRIRDSFQVEVALRTLFEKPTVEELTVAITEKQAERKKQRLSNILAELESGRVPFAVKE